MMLEVEFGEDSIVIELDARFKSALSSKVPFTTKLNIWKEEVYFETPSRT